MKNFKLSQLDYIESVLFFNHNFFLICKLQLLGSVVLGVGIWLAADKASFIALLKMVESENIEVSGILFKLFYLFFCSNLL